MRLQTKFNSWKMSKSSLSILKNKAELFTTSYNKICKNSLSIEELECGTRVKMFDPDPLDDFLSEEKQIVLPFKK